MYQQVYGEINLFCIGILIFVLSKVIKNVNKSASNIQLIKIMISLLIIMFSDLVWVFVEDKSSAFCIFLNYFTSATYMAFSGLVGYFSLVFTQCKLGIYVKQSPLKRFLITLPVFILFILSYSSYFTGLIFKVSSTGQYQRGILYFFQPAIPYLFFVISMAYILVELKKTKSYQKRSELMALISFFIFPIIGGILGVMFPGLPTTWPLTVFSIIFIYSNFQAGLIHTDGLTGLNNKANFEVFINQQILNKNNFNHVALLIMDIDCFKSINDHYGHYEGDMALISIANMLLEIDSNEPQKSFLTRFGGDEFSILYRYENKSDVYNFIKTINKYTDELNKNSTKDYNIHLSIGFETYSEDGANDYKSLLSGADKNMYAQKAKNKASRTA